MSAASAMTEKMPIFVIGKQWNRDDSKISETFLVITGQTKSWIDGFLFDKWVKELDKSLKEEIGNLVSL